MNNIYTNELDFIVNAIIESYANIATNKAATFDTLSANEAVSNYDITSLRTPSSFCMDKSPFDIVTTLDYNIEDTIIKKIHAEFPDDKILSEETLSDTPVNGRTWTIDPIDGTFNMAAGMPLYGVQCSMFDNGEPVVAAIWLPVFKEMYYAVKGGGAYMNGSKISTHFTSLDKSIISFGDFPHSRPDDIRDERIIMNEMYNHIARVRMFGAASIDFAYLASGKTQGTVIFTRNKWDISPGILLCKEAGALVIGDKGEYTPESRYVIAIADRQLLNKIIHCRI